MSDPSTFSDPENTPEARAMLAYAALIARGVRPTAAALWRMTPGLTGAQARAAIVFQERAQKGGEQ